MVDGILIIDKPAGLTSHDVVSRVRRILKTKRVGHTGTLDPFATGVLVLLIGKATRLAQFLDKDEKEYEAVVRFGFETDTGDRTGERKNEIFGEDIPRRLASVDWEKTFTGFRGQIEQIPPMYSAKKQDGKKLYELARKGIEIERKAVRININELDILRKPESGSDTAIIRVVCSAGTYIRTLAEEIGRSIGTGAHLQELRRIRAGRFDIKRAKTLDQLSETEQPENALAPVEEAISHLPKFVLEEDRIAKTQSGLATRIMGHELAEGEPLAMVNNAGELIAIGIFDAGESCMQPKIVL